jgi:hypothetical protein
MAQTKRKRRSKHRGNAAGAIETRGRTGRAVAAPAKDKRVLRAERLNRPPSWSSALNRAAIAAILFVVIIIVIGQKPATAIAIGALMLALYVPLGYYTDSFIYKRRNRGGKA